MGVLQNSSSENILKFPDKHTRRIPFRQQISIWVSTTTTVLRKNMR